MAVEAVVAVDALVQMALLAASAVALVAAMVAEEVEQGRGLVPVHFRQARAAQCV